MSIFLWLNLAPHPLPIAPDLVYEGIVLHDQDRKQKSANYMAMKYQKGAVYPSGKKVKMWYGKYLINGQDKHGEKSGNTATSRSARKPGIRSGRQSSCCER